MNEPVLKWTDTASRGAFVVEEGETRLAEMVFKVVGSEMTVFHTEVAEELKGKGVATKLFNMMVDYVRAHQLKVIPLCEYVHAQFKRHPELYNDIWKK